MQHRVQGQTHAGGDAASRLFQGGALHHRAPGGGETPSGGDGRWQRHDGWRPHPEVSTGGGESHVMMKVTSVQSLSTLIF